MVFAIYNSMRTEKDQYGTQYYLYKCDLERIDTETLLGILRSCRVYVTKWNVPEDERENVWCEYGWSDNGEEWYTMIWMVKAVLATREHIPTKKERRKIRQEKAKMARRSK